MLRTFLPALLLISSACGSPEPNEASWSAWSPSVEPTHDGISLYTLQDDTIPLRAWYARVDAGHPGVDISVVVAPDEDGRASVSELAASTGACLLVNAGYFRMDLDPSTHVGLLLSGGQLVHTATRGVYRDDLRYPVARAAIGFSASDVPSVGFVRTRSDSVFVLEGPPDNKPGTPAPEPESNWMAWDVVDAVSGGPALLKDGMVAITTDEEVFFGTSIPKIHPRTAAGLTVDGDLILMVVDGRQSDSRGVSLEELALLMQSAGAVTALNLDGGGSSTMVLDGTLVNRPTGGTFEREVVSAIAVHCSTPNP